MDPWLSHHLLSLLTDFSSMSYTGNTPLPPPLLSFLWVPRIRSCNPSHCAGAALAQYCKGDRRDGWRSRESLPDQNQLPIGSARGSSYTVIQTPMVTKGTFLGVEGWHAELVVTKSNHKAFFLVCFEKVTKIVEQNIPKIEKQIY